MPQATGATRRARSWLQKYCSFIQYTAAMDYEILRLYHLGVRRKKHDLDRAERISADIHIQKDQWGPLGRESLKAYAFSQNLPSVRDHLVREQEELPPLWDVRLDGMATLGFVIRGVEFVDKRMYQQEWHCRAPAGTFTVPWRLCPRGPLDELI